MTVPFEFLPYLSQKARDRAERTQRVAESGLFDADWYRNKYPDVANGSADPLWHFVEIGSAEGRSPGPGFDADWYLRTNPDVRAAGVQPLFHYLAHGRVEGRAALPHLKQGSVSDYWATNRKADRPRSWLEHPTLLKFVHQRVSGDPKIDTYSWFKQTYFPNAVPLALTIGCGLGPFERYAIKIGIAERFQANDISSGAIETAKALAAEAGLSNRIDYSVVDVDHIELPPKQYDAIFTISSAHHIYNLENLFRQCRHALKPTGLLLLDEYIGPSRFQSSPFVTAIINKLLSEFPPKYRKNLLADSGSLINRYDPSPIEHFEQNDPSEAIRSGELVSTLKQYFDIVEMRPYGGAILHMLFSGIMGNFDETNENDVALIRTIAIFEEALESVGAIGADFAAIVARPKP